MAGEHIPVRWTTDGFNVSRALGRSIEFFGLPGAGKTTIAKQLAADQGMRCVVPQAATEGQAIRWCEVLPNRRTMRAIPRALNSADRAGLKAILAAHVLQDRAVFNAPVVLEEAVAMRVWRQLFWNRLGESWRWMVVRREPLVVISDPATIRDRLRLRASSGPAGRALANAELGSGTWLRALELVETVAKASAAVRPVIRVSSEVDVLTAADEAWQGVSSKYY